MSENVLCEVCGVLKSKSKFETHQKKCFPRYCLNCNKQLFGKNKRIKFCCHNCSTKYFKKDVPKKYCIVCSKEITSKYAVKFCSRSCSAKMSNRSENRDRKVSNKKTSEALKLFYLNTFGKKSIEQKPHTISKNYKLQECPPWEIEKVIRKGEYNYGIVRGHPHATNNHYVLEHRIVMENYLNRVLTKDEVVHHINEDKKDNRIENLVVMDKKEHVKHHMEYKKRTIYLKCPWCEKSFTRTRNKTYLLNGTRYTCCSRRCSGKINRLLHLGRNVEELQQKIKENIIG